MAGEGTRKEKPAEVLFELFKGLDRARGRFDLAAKSRGKKVEGKAALVKEGPTVGSWEAHLAGEVGLGIVPIRDDGTCRFGAIDIDVYEGLDHAEVAARIKELKFPLVPCRSKSGGVHLYLFACEDVPAALLRNKLMEMAVALGYAGVEVFPKQSALAGSRDFGNWINMPYFNAAATQRWAIGPAGGQLELGQFLQLAKKLSVTAAALEQFEPNADDYFPDGPPCLQALATRGFPEGSRNNALYNMAVYLRKRHGEAGWDGSLDELNQRFVRPALGHQEVAGVAKSVRKKAYEYKCKEQPICQACNREICLTREFGIRGAKNDPGVHFGELIKIPTDPPFYLWDVNGERLELRSEELMDQRRFHKVSFERLNVWPTMVRPDLWQKLVREKLEAMGISDAPDEASRRGHLWSLLEDFFSSRPGGLSRDELLMKKPWTEHGYTFFRLTDFMQFLQQQGIRTFNEQDLWLALREKGARHGRWNIKGKEIKWWALPQFPEGESLDVPKIDGENI